MAEANDNDTLIQGGGPVFRQTIVEIQLIDFATKKQYFLPAAKVFKMYKHVLMEHLSLRKKTPSFEDFLAGKVAPATTQDDGSED